MQDFKRALYDYSAAIRAESKNNRGSSKNTHLAKYFCKASRAFGWLLIWCLYSGGWQVQLVLGLVWGSDWPLRYCIAEGWEEWFGARDLLQYWLGILESHAVWPSDKCVQASMLKGRRHYEGPKRAVSTRCHSQTNWSALRVYRRVEESKHRTTTKSESA